MDSPAPRHKPLANQNVTVDLDRRQRCGFPEVVYGEGKSDDAVAAVFDELLARGEPALATRISAAQAETLLTRLPGARYNPVARTLRRNPAGAEPAGGRGRAAVVSAGSTDLPVAEEARETLNWMGVDVTMVQDVGVAGPHRLPERVAEIVDSDAVVVVAGMEGALPSVVGGYVPCPVIGVPTSVGYGANFQGLSALLSMLNSCASNVTVVNIDAGFKGGYLAGLIATRVADARAAGEEARDA
ncbi:N5-carboxyaminoimidazole ribonucleotide mutase [Posidoniimonas corsicana]|uniref:N5-carboxyaminoimidazole ribonucleotide mutase n=1 Tax=Posidoniimonas corsicana TaxID=1938618 RepID=A0A5C5UV64_9BACT|nr:nickel pincer cofactor biosynthesis protein LarB [Posidoniimonas corsicana]TWT30266.1 N5-carboxyaminoimidazole ribonucleotide mutase [Posidoniimonas corsicana]